MLPKNLLNTIKKASDALQSKEQFLISELASRASKAASDSPYDYSIVQASNILNKIAETKLLITRAELNSLYDKLYVNNTKLKEVFASELDRKEFSTPKIYERTNATEDVNDYDLVANPLLANALAGVFDGSNQYRPYTKADAKRAEKICYAALMEIDLVPVRVSTFAGKDEIFLCQATYETPKGHSHVLIPIETKNGSALFPTMFLGQNSFIDLDGDLLRSHIVSTAGINFRVDADGILTALSQAKYGVKKVASDVEMALIRLHSEKGNGKEVFSADNAVIGMKIADVIDNEIKDPEYEKTQEHFDFAKRVESPEGGAQFVHGKDIVNAGRDIISRKMAQFGYKKAQVKVAGFTETQIKYAISVGVNAGLMTIVDVKNGNVFAPKIAIASGNVKEFSKDGIKELIADSIPDTKALAAASFSAGLKPSELIDQVKSAINEGNLIKAEDAINVLGEIDKNAQKVAIAILMSGLSEGKKASTMAKVATRAVYDVPVFNTYNVFFPED